MLDIKMWLKVDMILSNGVRQKRAKGNPPGGVISPLIANIFLHLCFDKWMNEYFPKMHFERYSDDIVVHCRNHK